ncbi:lactate/malate dehydrogenase, NAD binding domain-containing protein [Ditylenchus destructor]|uniref:Lactate/malate dehydrogenase, NAD binding domain-containing protein n=1 Tax=Ditylenchus destructor TaxID=166010 RepID=A0AAD4MR26_9BILA|nr:lactate/malate dehydrogenase, NAD binding domain-containing protein [Ditylenchus destructor]
MLDLQHGLAFIRHCHIMASTDYKVTAGSKVCVITAGCRLREGESRLSLVHRNVEIFKGIVPQLVKYSPDTLLLVVSNPVDVLTYVTWKLSGLPKERVFGSGTNLDSARFRFLLSERLAIAPSNCHGWIIGSTATQALRCHRKESEQWEKEIHQKVIQSADEIIKLKGYTSWAIGLSVASIVASIVQNSRQVFALSTNVNGIHGIAHDVYLSLPSVLGANGLTHVVKQNLLPKEREQLHKSADQLATIQADLSL